MGIKVFCIFLNLILIAHSLKDSFPTDYKLAQNGDTTRAKSFEGASTTPQKLPLDPEEDPRSTIGFMVDPEAIKGRFEGSTTEEELPSSTFGPEDARQAGGRTYAKDRRAAEEPEATKTERPEDVTEDISSLLKGHLQNPEIHEESDMEDKSHQKDKMVGTRGRDGLPEGQGILPGSGNVEEKLTSSTFDPEDARQAGGRWFAGNWRAEEEPEATTTERPKDVKPEEFSSLIQGHLQNPEIQEESDLEHKSHHKDKRDCPRGRGRLVRGQDGLPEGQGMSPGPGKVEESAGWVEYRHKIQSSKQKKSNPEYLRSSGVGETSPYWLYLDHLKNPESDSSPNRAKYYAALDALKSTKCPQCGQVHKEGVDHEEAEDVTESYERPKRSLDPRSPRPCPYARRLPQGRSYDPQVPPQLPQGPQGPPPSVKDKIPQEPLKPLDRKELRLRRKASLRVTNIFRPRHE